MSRVVRGQLALDIGERLKELGMRVLKFHEYSGDALELQLRSTSTGLTGQVAQLDTLVKSCRAAKNSYPNFPSLRKAIAEAGDECYDIQQHVYEVQESLHSDHAAGWDHNGKRLIELAQRLRLVQFVSESKEAAT